MFSVPPNSYFLSQHFRVLPDARLDCGIETGGVPEGRGHFVSLGGRLDPNRLLTLMDAFIGPFNALHGSHGFVVVVLVDEVGELAFCDVEPLGIRPELLVEGLQVSALGGALLLFRQYFMFLP